ncbi:MAG: branched-chain amino acid transport protein AzlC [Proteobacteria bacterium]|nr:MAG: branched-chain amino acid transport protein AzlC [Pseudomonadota bacterium]
MKEEIRKAVKAGIPIVIGYTPAAAAFGVLSKSCGLSLFESFFFSAMVYAGASQFIALNLMVTGMGPIGIIITTLLINFRHFLMSAYLATRFKHLAAKHYVVMAFGVTDEVFSVLSLQRGKISKTFLFLFQFLAYFSWVSGTVAGYLMGSLLPERLIQSMGVALYALLLAILIPEMRRSGKVILLVVISGILNTVMLKLEMLPNGWSIILCILIVAFIGSYLPESKTAQEGSRA